MLSFQSLHCHTLVKSFGPAAGCFHSFVLDFHFYTHMEVCFAQFAVPALRHTTEMFGPATCCFHSFVLDIICVQPVLVQILELYTGMTREGREIVFIWVPGHVGIRGNLAADSAAKDALDGDISVELIPFSDLK